MINLLVNKRTTSRSLNFHFYFFESIYNFFLMIFIIFVCLVTCIKQNVSYMYETEEFKPCPEVHPEANISINQLTGRWHLTLLVLDASVEDLEESDVCVTGEVILTNDTHIKQVWDMYTPNQPNDPVGTIELSVSVIKTGVWAVQTPLGAQLMATVFGHDVGYLMVAHCGWHRGKLVHLWTAGVTRENILTPALRIKLSALLLDNGYEPSTTKIITWSKC